MRLSRGWRAAAVLAAGAGLVACALAGAALPIFSAPQLGLDGRIPGEAEFRRPFEAPLPATLSAAAGGGRVELRHCRDWLARRTQVVGSDTDADWRVLRLQVAPCDALTLLAVAQPARRSALPAAFGSLLDTALYPASLWVAVSDDERQELARPGTTLREASGQARWRPAEPAGLALQGEAFGLRLTLLARGDFNRDGWEDAAFLWEAQATQGSYTDARLVVLTRRSANGPLAELPLAGLLPAR